jgi:hypothetical protein
MSNIIQFPKNRSYESESLDTIDKLHQVAIDKVDKKNCYVLSEYIQELAIIALEDQTGAPRFEDLDFHNNDTPESKDLFLITNLVYAMLLRFKGHEHHYHKAMDMMAEDLLAISKNNDGDLE